MKGRNYHNVARSIKPYRGRGTFDRLEEYGFNHYSINHSNEYAKDNIHINNCKNNLLKIWLSKFMGINKYNLNLYVKTYNLYTILKVLTTLRSL